MFAKLLKHEFRSNALALSILSLAAVCMGIMAGFLLRFVMNYSDLFEGMTQDSEALFTIAMSGSVMSLVFCIFGMFGCLVATGIILLIRYYRSRFTDQGYLTFTLPVDTHQIFLSAFLNNLIWLAIAYAALMLGAVLAMVIATVGTDYSASDLTSYFGSYDSDAPAAYTAVNAAYSVVSGIYTVVIGMSCITLASTWVKRNRILLAFGLYFGVSQVVSTLESFLSAFIVIGLEDYWVYSDTTDIYNDSILSTVILIVIKLGLIVGGYILSTQLMKNKLNLT